MKKSFILTGTLLSSLFVGTAANASTYSVQDGDNLWKISNKFDTNIENLKSLNKLSTNLIFRGQVLKVDNKSETHTVKAGDSLSEIAKTYKTSIQKLVKLNPEISNPNIILIGQSILLPEQAVAAPTAFKTVPPATSTTPNVAASKDKQSVSNSPALVNGTYTVKVGDTLSSIARANNKTVDLLLALNPEISNASKISIGQKIKVEGQVLSETKPAQTAPVQQEEKAPVVTETKPAQTAPVQQEEKAPVVTETKPAQTAPVQQEEKAPVVTETKPAQTAPVQQEEKAPVVTETKPAQTAPIQQEEKAPVVTETKPAQNNSAIANQVLNAGRKYLGAKYLYGASTSRTDAFDCSSFTLRAFSAVGIALPRTSVAQSQMGTPVSLNALQKGDLIFYDTDYDGVINHVGIYAGNGQMINASTSRGVSYAPINSSYWGPRTVKAVRVIK